MELPPAIGEESFELSSLCKQVTCRGASARCHVCHVGAIRVSEKGNQGSD